MDKAEDKYIAKLLILPKQFQEAAYQKKWGTAKYIYDTAIRVAEFLDVPEDIRKQLFGDRQDENNIIEGMFNEELVDRAYTESVVKLYKAYENESYRRYGQPPQYYPYPRYPVPGYEKE